MQDIVENVVFEGNKLIIPNEFWFNAKNILECGQFFRFNKTKEDEYEVLSGGNYASIKRTENGYEIITKNIEYFSKFFNLEQDYDNINKQLLALGVDKKVIDNAQGLRIIKSDIYETIVSFVISANNNIKRIKLIISRLCENAGEKTEYGYNFPSLEKFCNLTEEFFKQIGAGYRAKYLANLGKQLPEFLSKNYDHFTTAELKKTLMKLSGVGPKVADCILLFAFNRYDSFPVDVWIERAYYKFVGGDKLTRKNISSLLTQKFGDLSGYVQQYWFYYMLTFGE